MSAAPAEWIEWLLEQWTAGLASAVETMSGQRPEVAWEAASHAFRDPGVLWWEQPFDAAPRVAVWTGAGEAAWSELGASVLRSAGIEPTDALDSRNTYLEIVTQASTSLAQALSARLGRQIHAGEGTEAPPPSAGTSLYEVRLGAGAAPLYFTFDTALTDLFERRVSAPAAGEVSSPQSGRAAAAPEAQAPGEPGSSALDLLMDVELPVSVSFGRAELPLKDVLKLTTGSIVELNRAISEPVEVIVNNSVIARGEVVVVEGNYGIKISEIISRESRLRTLR